MKIYACYVPHKNANERQGKLRVVTNADMCKNSEDSIFWSVAGGEIDGIGPAGPEGPEGPEGPAGPGAEPTPASVVVLRSPVTGTTNGTTGAGSHLMNIMFDVSLDGHVDPVDLTPGTTRLRLDYLGQSITSTTLSRFHTTPVSGADSDLILEAGEVLQITLLDFETFLSPDLGEGTRFMIDVISEFGSVLSFEAETPDTFPGPTVVNLPLVTP